MSNDSSPTPCALYENGADCDVWPHCIRTDLKGCAANPIYPKLAPPPRKDSTPQPGDLRAEDWRPIPWWDLRRRFAAWMMSR
jgi:hypothetical protein